MMLNLATQPFVNRRRFYVLATASSTVLAVSLVVLAFAFIHNFRSEQGIRRDLRKVRDELAVLDTRQKRIEDALSDPRAVETLDHVEFLNTLIRQKAVSWTRIFMDLEKVMPERVQAVSLRPIVKIAAAGKPTPGAPGLTRAPLIMDLQMMVNGENIQNLIDLLHHLEASQNFRNPVVYNDTPATAAGNAPVTIQITKADGDHLYSMQFSVTYAQ